MIEDVNEDLNENDPELISYSTSIIKMFSFPTTGFSERWI